jgi:hypothetical protein
MITVRPSAAIAKPKRIARIGMMCRAVTAALAYTGKCKKGVPACAEDAL